MEELPKGLQQLSFESGNTTSRPTRPVTLTQCTAFIHEVTGLTVRLPGSSQICLEV